MRLSEIAETVEKLLADLDAFYTITEEKDEENFVTIDYHYRQRNGGEGRMSV